MKLTLRNIGLFTEKFLDLPDNARIIIVKEPSATGKTIIARTLYSFLTGHIDNTLLKHGAEKGEAILFLGDKEYKLSISAEEARVDRLVDGDYTEYLVLTEQTPLYKIYVAPPKQINIDDLVKEFVRKPFEMIRLENEMRQLSPKVFDVDSIIEGYEREIDRRRRRVEELRRELEKIEEEVKKMIPVEKADAILRKRELETRIKELKKSLEEKIARHARLLSEIQLASTDYDKLKQERKNLVDEIDRLHRETGMLEDAREGYEKIKEGLRKLQGIVDILYDLDIPLFGQLVTSDTIDMFISDCESAIQILSSKYVELRTRISELEKKKSEIEALLQEHVRKHEEISRLEVEIEKLKRELRDLEYKYSSIRKRAEEILLELGLTEEDLIKRLMEQEKMSNLLNRKKEIQKEIENLEYEISDIQKALENARKQREEILEKKREYDELKKQYNVLRNEFQRKREVFKKVFREGFREAFRNITIRDFDFKSMKLLRSPYTYAQSERLMLAIAYQYSLVKALLATGYNIPLVVVDLIVPLDSRWYNEVLRLYRDLNIKTIFLETSDESKIVPVE